MASLYADAAAFGSFGFRNSDVGLEQDLVMNMTASSLPPSDIGEIGVKHCQPPSCEFSQVSSALSLEDFIVFAEFSEVTGPIPLLTIPTHIANIKDFDINSFIMQIMSVDYQSHACSSGRFHICEDVQVLQSENGLTAYIHYTTLHDLLARGWVRPLCIAYISSDSQKLHTYFPVLRKTFLQMTKILKYNNRIWFMEEILKVLDSFKAEQDKYLYLRKREDDGHDLSSDEQRILKLDFDQIIHQYTEYKHVLHCIEPLLDDEGCHNIVEKWKKKLLEEPSKPQVTNYLSQLHYELETFADCTKKDLHLRSILTLSPWGFAASIWILYTTLKNNKGPYINMNLESVESDETCNSEVYLNMEEALDSLEYMSLLENVLQSVNHHGHGSENTNVESSSNQNDFGEDHQGQGSAGSSEVILLSSATEASSYHSLSESLSDLPKDVEHSSDNESFLDISETFLTDESGSDNEPDYSQGNVCVWRHNDLMINPSFCDNGKPSHLLKFFRTFNKEACHLIYALLIGRTIVLAGSEMCKRAIMHFIAALCPLVPVVEKSQVNSLPWHCGILVSSHVTLHHLIGLCVPERLAVHDMINAKDKNHVTILDVTNKQIFGPAYSGDFLACMEKMLLHLPNAHGLHLYLQSIAATIKEKVFVYRCSQGYALDKPSQVLKRIGLHGCDSEIVKFFFDLKL